MVKRTLWSLRLVLCRQRGEETGPVEERAGVGLAAGRDVGVRGDVAQRMAGAQRGDEADERRVLRVGEGRLVHAFELDADREIVAALAPAPARDAGVPRPLPRRHELDQAPVAADEEMG